MLGLPEREDVEAGHQYLVILNDIECKDFPRAPKRLFLSHPIAYYPLEDGVAQIWWPRPPGWIKAMPSTMPAHDVAREILEAAGEGD